MEPLASILRPKTLDDFIGQKHLVGSAGPITTMIRNKRLSSIIFWGPPGSGKTTLAKIIASHFEAHFVALSAIDSGVAEIKKIIEDAKHFARSLDARPVILFVDEIHRFSKLQQDSLLGSVEAGIITLIAATTENPGFSVNKALVSRCHIYHLEKHDDSDLQKIFANFESLYKAIKLDTKSKDFLISFCNGDVRKLINALELCLHSQIKKITLSVLQNLLNTKTTRYDKTGEDHYSVISAYIKSMRAGQKSAAMHYLARMIDAGEDPLFIARRLVIFASEDIGLAQNTALVVATAAYTAVANIGYPECSIVLAHATAYMCEAPKNTKSYNALNAALADVKNKPYGEVPMHLVNPVNGVLKDMGAGEGHVRYPHESPGTKLPTYMPKGLEGTEYFG